MACGLAAGATACPDRWLPTSQVGTAVIPPPCQHRSSSVEYRDDWVPPVRPFHAFRTCPVLFSEKTQSIRVDGWPLKRHIPEGGE